MFFRTACLRGLSGLRRQNSREKYREDFARAAGPEQVGLETP